MTATNLFSGRRSVSSEYWFAGIKVAAIVVFLALGSLFVLGLWPHKSLDFSNLWSHGRLSLGVMAITVGVVTVIFSMVGLRSRRSPPGTSDPERAVGEAAELGDPRIAIFFVGSIFLLVTILPWNGEKLAASPFVSAFTEMGIPYAVHIMNAVVLTAAVSCRTRGCTPPRGCCRSRGAPREPAQLVVSDPSRSAGQRDPGILGRRPFVRHRRGVLGNDLHVPAQLQRGDTSCSSTC